MSAVARRQWDVAVIGAGIVGAATAYYLSKAGCEVVVLEQGDINREGSGATAGNIHVQGIHPRRPGQEIPADVARFLPLQIAARALWEHLEEELGQSLELNRHGGLMVAETETEVAELHAKRALEAKCGLASEIVTGDDARRLLPDLSDTVLAADWCSADGYANPLLVTPAYLRAAELRGTTVMPFSKVEEITREDESYYTLRTGTQVIAATYVVNAAGPWIRDVGRLMGVDVAVSAIGIQMHVTRRVPSAMNCLVQHVGQALSVKRVAAGNLLVGGGWPGEALTLGYRSAVSTASMRANLGQAARVLPLIRQCEVLRIWTGPLAVTADELPVVGPLPGRPNCFVAGGTYAFTLAPLWGCCLAALISGDHAPVDLTGLGVERLTVTPGGQVN